jgi:hypothetical protein
MFTSTVNGTKSQMDTQGLEAIFGYKPRINFSSKIGDLSFESGKMIAITGLFLEILSQEGDILYTVANPYKREVNGQVTNEAAYFAGPWNETGQKIANLYFSKLPVNAIVCFNNSPKKLDRNSEGTINFV